MGGGDAPNLVAHSLTQKWATRSVGAPPTQESLVVQHYQDSVAAFHRAIGVPRWPHLASRHERIAMTALRATLVEDGTGQYFKALCRYHQRPTNEAYRDAAKELAGLLYVVAGTADVFECELMDSDITDGGMPYLVGDITLVRHSKRVTKDLTDLMARVVLYAPEYELEQAFEGTADSLQLLCDRIVSAAQYYGMPIRRVFDAVHASNMSKIDPATGKAYFRQDGKILKGPNYQLPDLSFMRVVA